MITFFGTLAISSLLTSGHEIWFHLFNSLISLIGILYFSVYRPCTFLVCVFHIFDVINGNVNYFLLVYRNNNCLSALTLYTANLLNYYYFL